jgi:hypothetical protein
MGGQHLPIHPISPQVRKPNELYSMTIQEEGINKPVHFHVGSSIPENTGVVFSRT